MSKKQVHYYKQGGTIGIKISASEVKYNLRKKYQKDCFDYGSSASNMIDSVNDHQIKQPYFYTDDIIYYLMNHEGSNND